jgi:hypothetical protein
MAQRGCWKRDSQEFRPAEKTRRRRENWASLISMHGSGTNMTVYHVDLYSILFSTYNYIRVIETNEHHTEHHEGIATLCLSRSGSCSGSVLLSLEYGIEHAWKAHLR